MCIYNVFARYFYLGRIVLSREQLQSYIWVVPIISWGHLRWSTFFIGTVLLWIKHLPSSPFSKVVSQFVVPVAAIHSMDGRFSITKKQLQPRIISNLLYCNKEISWLPTNEIYLVLGMYILNVVCYLTTSNASIHFVMSALLRAVCLFKIVLQSFIITNCLWLIQKNLKNAVFIWENTCSTVFLEVSIFPQN